MVCNDSCETDVNSLCRSLCKLNNKSLCRRLSGSPSHLKEVRSGESGHGFFTEFGVDDYLSAIAHEAVVGLSVVVITGAPSCVAFAGEKKKRAHQCRVPVVWPS